MGSNGGLGVDSDPGGTGFEGFEVNSSQVLANRVGNHTNNATMNSMGNDKVVLIRMPSSDLFSNPIKGRDALDNSILKDLEDRNLMRSSM